MNTTETVLVILLSVGMITLIILSIVLVSILIAITRNVRKISDRAEQASANVAEITGSIAAKLAPMAVQSAVAAAMRRFGGRRGKGDKDK
jgi:hypothetical protein